MATRQSGRFWKRCRTCFRWCRITVWLVILVLVAALAYVNQIGLPGFIKRPLLENLRARGLELRFSRLRLRWYRGVVAENVQFGRPDEPLSPQLTLQEVQVRLNHHALSHLRLQVDSLVLRQGRLVWPIPETNQAPRQLTVDDIQTDLRFLPNDEWTLDNFTSTFAGARISLTGAVTNASAVSEWRFFQARQTAAAGVWQNRLRQLADTLEGVHFPTPPELKLDLRGDARDPLSFTARLRATAPSAETPWGSLTRGHATVGLYPPGTNRVSRAELSLGAEAADTPWGRTENLQFAAHLSSAEGRISLATGEIELSAGTVHTKWAGATNLHVTLRAVSDTRDTNLLSAALTVSAGPVGTPWGSATNALFTAYWLHALTNAIPLSGDAQLAAQDVNTQWGAASRLWLKAHGVTLAQGASPNPGPSWAAWRFLAPYMLDWEAQVTELRSPQLAVQQVSGGGSWSAPKLAVTNLVASLEGRRLEAHAGLDVATRDFTLKFWSNLDPHRAGPLVAKEAERWLTSLAWDQPPELQGEVSLIVPAWTNRPPSWQEDLRSSVRLNSEVTLAQGVAYRDVRFSRVHSHLLYSNGCWRLPDLALTQPSGRLDAALAADPRTTEYSAHISSSLDPRTLRPALSRGAGDVLKLFTFTEAPRITADLRGRWEDPKSIGAQGQVSLTNFTFREQAISGVQTGVQYTNQFLQFIAPRVQRGARQAAADGIGADFIEQKVYITNALSAIEPMVIAHVIGAHVARAIEPYQFEQPPVGHVYGTVPMYGEEAADLHFELAGGPFNWWRFHIPEISGHIHWLGLHLRLSNMRMRLYGGQAQGSAGFDFHPGAPTDYHFSITTTNTDLQPAVADLFLTTNRLRGALSGSLTITNANTTSLQTWNGFGNAHLRDGLIWDIPIFGTFSDVLNGMYPGLGSSRPSAGTCTFGIANGVIQSSDLEINATAVRLEYRGTVDFDGRVKARVEAGLLRDMWLVGPVVSTVFWPVSKLFEYKVSGTLSQPKAEPVFLIPKVMLLPFQMPFHPFRTLKGLLPEDFGTSRTNSLPLNPPKGR